MNQRLVLITQVFFPDPTSTSILFSPLLFEYARCHEGDVDVFCGYPVTGNFTNLKRKETLNKVNIKRLGITIEAKKNLVWRAVSYIAFLGHVFIEILKLDKSTKVVCVTNPPFLFWFVAVASRIRRFNFAHVVLDMHPEGWIALGKLRRKSLVSRLWLFLNKYAYQSASVVAILGRDMIPILRSNYCLENEKLRYMPHWSAIPSSESVLEKDFEFTDKFGARNKFVVQYSGNMGVWHDIETFVRAANVLRDRDDILFIFIGGGVRHKKAFELAKELDVNNIVWHDFVPLEDLDKSLSVASVSLISLREGLSGIAVPCKLYGILSSGRPVLAAVPGDSEVALTINQHNCGIVVPPGNVDQLVNSILMLSSDDEAVAAMGLSSLEAHNGHYSLKIACETFGQIVKSL